MGAAWKVLLQMLILGINPGYWKSSESVCVPLIWSFPLAADMPEPTLNHIAPTRQSLGLSTVFLSEVSALATPKPVPGADP